MPNTQPEEIQLAEFINNWLEVVKKPGDLMTSTLAELHNHGQ